MLVDSYTSQLSATARSASSAGSSAASEKRRAASIRIAALSLCTEPSSHTMVWHLPKRVDPFQQG